MAKTKPVVSVIMPVFNGERFIGEAVASVLAQTYDNLELIVVDDGSTDSTKQVLEGLDGKLKVINEPHVGVSHARNVGIKASVGQYIAFIDSDDIWEPSKLQLQTDYLNSHADDGLVYSYSTNFTDSSDGNVSLVKKVDVVGHAFKQLVRYGGVANSTVMVRKSALDKVGYFDESLVAMEDYDLYLRISRKYSIGRVPESLMRRRIHLGSFYSSGYDNQYVYQFPVYEKLLADSATAKELGTTQSAFMTNFVTKFIYKNIYDGRNEFIASKMTDLAKYAPLRSRLVRILVKSRVKSPFIWKHLILDFDIWDKELAHKAALYHERQKKNFSSGRV